MSLFYTKDHIAHCSHNYIPEELCLEAFFPPCPVHHRLGHNQFDRSMCFYLPYMCMLLQKLHMYLVWDTRRTAAVTPAAHTQTGRKQRGLVLPAVLALKDCVCCLVMHSWKTAQMPVLVDPFFLSSNSSNTQHHRAIICESAIKRPGGESRLKWKTTYTYSMWWC